MGYVSQVKINRNGSALPVGSSLYGTCSSASDAVAKVVSLSNFDTRITGVTVYVKFTNSNTAANPTLNVNSTGASPIVNQNGGDSVIWRSGQVLPFTFDGTNWNTFSDESVSNYILGNPVVLSDSVEAPIGDITLYGKSTQTGNPSPASPISIDMAGSDGYLPIISRNSDLSVQHTTNIPVMSYGFPGILGLSSQANYTDSSGKKWACDTINLSDGIYTKRVGVITLDGSQSFSISNSGTANWFYNFSTVLSDMPASSGGYPVSTHYPRASISNGNTNQGFTTAGNYIRIRYGTQDTVANYTSWLQSNPVTFLYPLATPITIDLTSAQIEALQDIRLLSEETGIYNNDDVDMGITYLRLYDGNQYYLKLFNQLKNQLASLQEAASARGVYF